MAGRRTVVGPVSLVIALAVVTVAVLIAISPIGKAIDRFYLDTLFNFRGELQTPQDIVIIGIDEDSFAEINQQWPWPRMHHVQLLHNLYEAGASAVVFDVIFSEPSTPLDDAAFSDVVNRHSSTILAMDIDVIDAGAYVREVLVKPANTLDIDDSQTGFINVPIQPDGFVREMGLVSAEHSALSLLAAKAFKKTCCKRLPDNHKIRLNYFGGPGTIKTVSYYQALELDKYLSRELFDDKLVFVGFVTKSVADPTKGAVDHFPVPFTRGDVGYMPGVEIHATSAYNLLHENYIKDVSSVSHTLLSITLAVAVAVAALYLLPLAGLLMVVLLGSMLVGASVYLFMQQLVFMPIALMLMPMILGYSVSPSIHLYNTTKEKRFIQNAFGAFVSPAVVEELIDNPDMLALGGKNVEASVLFLDIAGFTTMSEKFEPTVLISIMNNCLSEITEIVLRHDGMIDKFIGDAVMAVWGAPVEREDHAYRACLAAMEIQIKMKEVARIEKKVTGAELAARVGVNSGTMVAGNVGGHRRFEYTVHGNDVNVASRLEGANKFYGTEIMIGENTAALLDGQFDLRQLDNVRLKGKKKPVALFELQALSGTLNQEQALCNQYYEKGMHLYECNMFTDAIENFRKGLGYVKGDGPCLSMIERCKTFIGNPPPEDWGGVFDMTSK